MAVFNEPTQWDHELGNNADVSTLPDDTGATTGVASLQKLFQIINQTPLEAGGVAPDREDFNALFKYLGDQIFYTQNGGVPSYNNSYDYAIGRVVLYNGNIYKCIQANGASSTVVAPDSDDTYWQQLDGENTSTSLIPNQIIQSPVPLTDANLHLLDGALLSGSGAYADYVTMMGELYTADPTATCWTDEATWQASVTTYGECGKFVYDSVNNTLRLPKLSSFIQATTIANELGTLVEAGAPNIIADSNYASNYGLLDNGQAGATPTGAFKFGVQTANRLSLQSGLGAHLSFDASLSNPIYGNSSTIQPQAIKYYFYIVVGTVSKTDIQIDIDNVMADLALKADTDLSNATPTSAFATILNNVGIRTVVESYVNGQSGYRVYSDGFCEQWGTAQTVNDALSTANFLKNFRDTNYHVNINFTTVLTNNFTSIGFVNQNLKTVSSFQFTCNSYPANNPQIYWFACGFVS